MHTPNAVVTSYSTIVLTVFIVLYSTDGKGLSPKPALFSSHDNVTVLHGWVKSRPWIHSKSFCQVATELIIQWNFLLPA